MSYNCTAGSEMLRATILYERSADFEEAPANITVLSDTEFKDEDTAELFSYRLAEISDLQGDLESRPSPASPTPEDEDCAPSHIVKRISTDSELRHSWTIAKWRLTLGNPRLVDAERLTEALIAKVEDLEDKVMTHEMLLHTCHSYRDNPIQEQDYGAPVLPNVPALQFLASRMLKIIEKSPPPPSKVSQSSRNIHKTLPLQHWFEAEAECTLQDFDKIQAFSYRHKNAEVSFNLPYVPFSTDVQSMYKITFHDFSILMWVLAAHSLQSVHDMLVKVKYDRAKPQGTQDPLTDDTQKDPVSIDLFGCLLHDPESETNPTYVTIGEAGRKSSAEMKTIIGRPDSTWSHVEATYVHHMQILEVEDVHLQHTIFHRKRQTAGRIPFSLTWSCLESQLHRATSTFGNVSRHLVLGKIVVQLPYISIRDRVECKKFLEVYNQLLGRNM